MAKKSPTTTKRPAQVAASTKAAQLKAENAAKRPQPLWLQQRPKPVLESDELPPAPERVNAAHQSQGPPRLLDKGAGLCDRQRLLSDGLGVDEGRDVPAFARGRRQIDVVVVEVDAWMSALPLRPLKGDTPLEAAE